MIVFFFIILFQIQAFHSEIINYSQIFEILIPTLNSKNLECKIQSEFYLQELKKSKLWANEMFDSSSKFPSGILFGSTTDFGNFDECIDVNVSLEDNKLLGRYCMSKIVIKPLVNIENKARSFYSLENNKFNNIWEIIEISYRDRSKLSRNEIYFSFCIPSVCTHYDLKESVNKLIEKYQPFVNNLDIEITIDKDNCYVKEELSFSVADQMFLTIIGFILIFITFATFYNLLRTKRKLNNIFTERQCSESKNIDGIDCINGLKVMSMFLIIMGHRIMFTGGSPVLNSVYIESKYAQIETMFLLNGPIIVDTFFTISGFIACYLLLKEFDNGKKINYLAVCLHRFLRLTPSYAIVIAFYCTVFVKMGSGPLWMERIGKEQERCLESWWTNLLYINNYVNKDNICMIQSWFISCDLHYFLICMIIVTILHKNPRTGIIILISLIVASMFTVFTTIYMYEEYPILLTYVKFLRDPVLNSTYKNIYIPTHLRATPYLLGILAAYIKYRIKTSNYEMPKSIVFIGWPIGFLLNLATIFSAFIFYRPEAAYSNTFAAFYGAIHHFTWSLGISWIIIAISEGNGVWFKPLLCWKPFTLLSRITYTAFLCHSAIQLYTVASLRSPVYISIFNITWYVTADITLSYIIGFVLSILFESPIIQLGKLILQKDSKVNNLKINDIKIIKEISTIRVINS